MTDKEFQKFMIEHMTKMSDDISDLRQNMVRLEFQLTEKIDALIDKQNITDGRLDNLDNKMEFVVDTITAVAATVDGHTERLQRIEDKTEHHDIRIKVLDETKSNKRKATK